MDLESVAAELSVLPPAEFVARRAQLAKAGREEATAAGGKAAGRELAEAIKHLAKPSAAAWAVNLLATRRPGEFEAVAALGASVRAAIASGEPAALSSLTAERRSTLGRATAAALELAEHALASPPGSPAPDDASAGDDAAAEAASEQRLSPAVANDVEQTLQAVLADPAAAAAARTGRLVRTLAATGVEAVDLDGAVSGPFTPPEPDDEDDSAQAEDRRPAGAGEDRGVDRAAKAHPAPDADAAGARAAASAAEAADAAAALEAVERQLEELTELRSQARERSDSLGDEIDELEARRADIDAELSERRAEQTELEDRLDETDREFGRLDRQREKAARRASVTARAAER